MAKLSMINKEERRKKLVLKYAKRRSELLTTINHFDGDEKAYQKALKAFNNIPRDGSPCRQRRRCNQCGRPKGVYRRFGLCRICLRNAMVRGDVPGLAKASW